MPHAPRPRTGRSWLLPALIALSFGCDEDGSGCSRDCEKCTEALEHMAAKIESFGCNPGVMGNALNRIEEDCEDNSPSMRIGIIVEECNANEGISVHCSDRRALMAFDFFIDPIAAELYPNGVRFRVTRDDPMFPVKDGEFIVQVGETHRFTLESSDSQPFLVQLSDPDDPEGELASEQRQVFIRETTDHWTNYQFRTVVATESEDGLPIAEFVNFD